MKNSTANKKSSQMFEISTGHLQYRRLLYSDDNADYD